MHLLAPLLSGAFLTLTLLALHLLADFIAFGKQSRKADLFAGWRGWFGAFRAQRAEFADEQTAQPRLVPRQPREIVPAALVGQQRDQVGDILIADRGSWRHPGTVPSAGPEHLVWYP